MRKKLAVTVSLIVILSLSLFGVISHNQAHARKAQVYLEIPDSVKKENEFTVKVMVDSDVDLYSLDAYLSYSADTLEFIPDSEFVSGADGVLEIKDIYGEETNKAEYEITFKALKTGGTEIALTDVYLIDYADLDYITVASMTEKFEVGINDKVADDASLKDLLVAPGEMTEPFNRDKLDYEVHVGMDVEMIGISAIPVNEDSVIELDMPEKLAKGDNQIVITVTALSGSVKVYTINVIRKDWPEEPSGEVIDDTEKNSEDLTENQGSEDLEQTVQTEEESSQEEPIQEESTQEGSTQEEPVQEEQMPEDAM